MRMIFLRICCLYMVLFGVSTDDSTEDGKRILMNDPESLQQQLNHLQSEFQMLQSKHDSQLNNLQSEFQTLQSKHDSQLNNLQAEFQTLQAKYNVQQQTPKAASFVRWGRKDCPSNVTQLVYTGSGGGAWYHSGGSAVDFLCLPSVPSWGERANEIDPATVELFGAEYQQSFVFGMSNENEEVPCAVCLSTAHTTSLMIPAQTSCPAGWSEAYHGYLGAGYKTASGSGSRYICVDGNPESFKGNDGSDDDGRVLVSVKTRCGSLKCPPYENNKILSCTVCLK